MRVIPKIKLWLRRSPRVVAYLIQAKRVCYLARGKGWIPGWDDKLDFLRLPLARLAFNSAPDRWLMASTPDDEPIRFFE